MNIIIPAYLNFKSNLEVIRDLLFVDIYTFFKYGNKGTVIIPTNNEELIGILVNFKRFYNFDIVVEKIDYEREWSKLGLSIGNQKERRNFIISKILPIFIYNFDFIMMDWDILNTEEYISKISNLKETTFFNPKNYDGLTIRQVSLCKKLKPLGNIDSFRWLNTGFVFFKNNSIRPLIREYWDKFNSIQENKYKEIYLFDIIGDELIYNLMKIDGVEEIKECIDFNINVIPKNFCFSFYKIENMEIGKEYPYILNVHFSVGHIKPYNVIIDDNGNLEVKVTLEPYNQTRDEVRWCFDMSQHQIGSHHYNALLFSIIWQYKRYKILEEMGITEKDKRSSKYLKFFESSIKNV